MAAPAYSIGSNTIVELSLRMSIFDQTVLLVRHYRISPDDIGPVDDGPGGVDDLMESWDDPTDGVTAKMQTYYTTDVKFQQIRGQVIYPTRWAYRTRAPQVGTGSITGTIMPQNTTVVVTLQSVVAGRKGRGNVFLTGFESSIFSGGFVTGIGLSHANNIAGSLTRNLMTITQPFSFNPVIYSRKTPTTPNVITGQTPQQEARVMRRRTVGRGI